SFAEFAKGRLAVDFDGSDFARASFEEADRAARDKASRLVQTSVLEAIEENLGAEDSREWNWQALAHQMNTRYGLQLTDRALKTVGKDNLAEHLIAEAEKALETVDLSEGKPFLEPDWGLRSLADWARLKYGLKLTVDDLRGKGEAELKAMLREQL